MNFEESQTYKNLNTAFNTELQTAARYNLYSRSAIADNNLQVSKLFLKLADNELAHAEIWNRLICVGKQKLTDSLRIALEGEEYSWNDMYKKFSRTARREGYEQIAKLFESVGAIEYRHYKELKRLFESAEQGNMLCGSNESIWICSNCGSLFKSKIPPVKCPVCAYPQGYFTVFQK